MRHNQGNYVIDVQRQTSRFGPLKRTKKIDWIVDYKNTANQVEYIFDFEKLERRVTTNGNTETSKFNLPAGASGESYTLQIEMMPEQIVIKDGQGAQLDKYSRPSRAETLGRFGFKGDVSLAVKKAEEL